MVKVVRTPGPGHTIVKALAELNENQVGVGWFKTAKYGDGTPVAYIAAIQEFGYAPKNIPPRLGLRQLCVDKKAEWAELCSKFSKLVINGASVFSALTGIGGEVATAIQQRISDVKEPELKESTLRNRASRLHIPVTKLTETAKKPLVEPKQKDGTPGGALLGYVTFLVGSKKQGELVE